LGDHGGKILEDGNLVPLQESSMASIVNLRRVAGVEFGIEAEWEISASELTILNKLGEGEFGEVFKARYHGTFVAVKQLKSSDQIALGDFRTEMATLRKLHHPNAVQFLGACTRKQPYLIVTELMSCSLSTAFNLLFSLTLRRQVRLPSSHDDMIPLVILLSIIPLVVKILPAAHITEASPLILQACVALPLAVCQHWNHPVATCARAPMMQVKLRIAHVL
jgi:hypothetical protein